MSASTNVPAIQFTPTGVVIPAESDIITGLFADFNLAFGGGLDPNLETPHGQLISSLAAIIGDKNDKFALLVNQFDPQYSSGRIQDAIGKLYFIDRKPATATVVQAQCNGLQDVVIPPGAMAVDKNNNVYIALVGGTFDITGILVLSFQCVTFGPTQCPPGFLNRIYQAISGWDSINNIVAGVPGQDVENRQDFEYRRQQSVAINGKGSLPSIYGAVFDLDNVIDCYATENYTSAPIVKGSTNYSLVPHSLYVAVVGGDPTAIANAIWSKKDTGCDYNGNTTVNVYDQSGYDVPFPSYPVTFEIPTNVTVNFAVTIKNDPNLPANLATLVKAAILASFVGADGGSRARIGSEIYASRYYGGIVQLSPFIGITALLISTGGDTPNQTAILMGIDQAPVTSASNITVTVV